MTTALLPIYLSLRDFSCPQGSLLPGSPKDKIRISKTRVAKAGMRARQVFSLYSARRLRLPAPRSQELSLSREGEGESGGVIVDRRSPRRPRPEHMYLELARPPLLRCAASRGAWFSVTPAAQGTRSAVLSASDGARGLEVGRGRGGGWAHERSARGNGQGAVGCGAGACGGSCQGARRK